MPLDPQTVTFKFAKDWLPNLLGILRKQRATREQEINRIADEFGDPVQLAEFYVEPHCQQFNPADDDEDEVRYIVRELIFTRLRYFFGGHSLTGGHQLFLLADSGMGKSSALMMLKLAHMKRFWPSDYDCRLMKLGTESIVEIEAIPKKRKCILLLDALDEDPHAWGRIQHRLRDLLIATRHFWRVIISCRTQFFSAGEDPFNRRGKVEVTGIMCPVIYLSLFSDEQIDDYLARRFPRQKKLIREAKALLVQMHSLRFRPMLLAHIEDLLKSETRDWTEYTIYEALVSAWLLREHAKPLPGRTMPKVHDLWRVCSALALHLHTAGRREMDEEQLRELAGARRFKHLSKLDIGGRSLLNKNSKGEYRFSHYSVQEFLVARNVILGTTSNVAGSIRPTDQLVSFIFSWLASHEVSARSKLPLATLNFEGASLRGSDLRGVNLKAGLLGKAQLAGADFSEANLEAAVLSGAELTKAKLINANLTRAKIRGANLVKADLTGAILRKADFRKADFRDADLRGANMSEAGLHGANLSKADLTGAILQRTDLRGAYLDGADLSGANISKASLQGANLSGSNLRAADLSSANLSRAELMRADLRDTNLDFAILENSTCDQGTKWPNLFDIENAGVMMKDE